MKDQQRVCSCRSRPWAWLAGFALSLLVSVPVQSDVTIANAPLFTISSIEPNIMFILDDSGSMFFEVTPDDLGFLNTATFQMSAFVFPRADNVYGGGDYANSNMQVATVAAGNPYTAIIRSPQLNATYYNPSITYLPWMREDGTRYPDAAPACALHNPENAGACPAGAVNHVARNLTVDNGNFNSNRWRSCNSMGACASTTDLMTFWPATYYWHNGGNEWLWANYTQVEIRPGTPTYDGHGRAARSDCVGGVCTYEQEIKNFANWYTYYRSRILASRAGIGEAFSDYDGGMRVGYGTINAGSSVVDGVSTRTIVRGVRLFTGAGRDAFYQELYTRPISPEGTPLRRALDAAGQYYSRSDSRGPWSSTPGVNGGDELACRQSYTIMMTDGYWSGGGAYDADTAAARANVDNVPGPLISSPDGDTYQYTPTDPYRDGRGNTLADIAMYYWNRDLYPDLDNLVPTMLGYDAAPGKDAHPGNDAFWQHMVTYGIGLGVSGSIVPSAAWAAARAGTPIAWPDPSSGSLNCSGGQCAARLDDLLHAGINSRGGFFSVADPVSFGVELGRVLDAVRARADTSATSAATSSSVLQANTLLYTAGFRTGDWSGKLEAYEVDPDGAKGGLQWDAEALLAERPPATRSIWTTSGGAVVPFSFGNLTAAQQAALNTNPDGVNDGLGAARVSWLRGDDAAHPSLRSRSASGELRLLGDIINSSPQVQDNVLYVGANDGMLHAFNASTGEELFAYIPSELLDPETNGSAPLATLPDQGYVHRYYVDGDLAVADLTFLGGPKVLIGSLGAGGRSMFALDVSAPGTFNLLWEFTHPELGYKPGIPAITQLADGTFAAVFGNGYNSTSHQAQLFIVNLMTGSQIDIVNTGAGGPAIPNGLAAPVVTAWPKSGLKAARAYAGDLLGNLWRFDLDGGSPPVTFFTATDTGGVRQPITAAPVVALNPDNDQEAVIAFGTGSYFRSEDKDMPGAQVHSLYGIIDTKPGVAGVARGDLLVQTIDSQTTAVFGGKTYTVRIVSDNDFNPAVHAGWVLDLSEEDGERVISRGGFPTGAVQRRVRFTTLIPDDEDPCRGGRRGFLMDIDLLSGGRKSYSVFDLNDDGFLDNLDELGDDPVSGIERGYGEEPITLIPEDPEDLSEHVYSGDGSSITGLSEDIRRRESWQQLR